MSDTKKCARKPMNDELVHNLSQVPEFCPATQIGRAYKSILRVFEEAFRSACVTATQFQVLVHIGFLDEPGGTELAKRLGSDPSTVSRILETLEKKELIESRSGQDRRTRQYALTDYGRSAVEDGLASWELARNRVLSDMDDSDWNSVVSLLNEIGHSS
ncbi:MAG: MarR family winged helix-turn-helix transcriptional regulator [Spirochaetales bacterium]